jgi:hypothetical protein
MAALKRIKESLDVIDISVEKHEIFLRRIQELLTKEPEW